MLRPSLMPQIGCFAESFIGALMQDTFPWLTNELVNFVNTAIGAAAGVAIAMLAL